MRGRRWSCAPCRHSARGRCREFRGRRAAPQVLLARIMNSATSLSSGEPRLRWVMVTIPGPSLLSLLQSTQKLKPICHWPGLATPGLEHAGEVPQQGEFALPSKSGPPFARVSSLNTGSMVDGAGWRRSALISSRLSWPRIAPAQGSHPDRARSPGIRGRRGEGEPLNHLVRQHGDLAARHIDRGPPAAGDLVETRAAGKPNRGPRYGCRSAIRRLRAGSPRRSSISVVVASSIEGGDIGAGAGRLR